MITKGRVGQDLAQQCHSRLPCSVDQQPPAAILVYFARHGLVIKSDGEAGPGRGQEAQQKVDEVDGARKVGAKSQETGDSEQRRASGVGYEDSIDVAHADKPPPAFIEPAEVESDGF